MAHLDVPAVRIRALRVVVDLMMWHGLAAFITSDNSTADDDDDAKSDDGMSTMSQQVPLTLPSYSENPNTGQPKIGFI